MRADLPLLEAFLRAFHDERPGLTAQAFGARPVVSAERSWPASYAALADIGLDGWPGLCSAPRASVPAGLPQILDLACGEGHLLEVLNERCGGQACLHGVDLSQGELALARARLGDRAHLVRARAQQLPYADGGFQRVFSHMAVMLMDGAPQVVTALRRVLAPGGRLCVSAMRVGGTPQAWPNSCCRCLAIGDWRFTDLHLSKRLTAHQAWLYMLNMYDLHLIEADSLSNTEADFAAALEPMLGDDGKVDLPVNLRVVSATATAIPG